MIGERDLVPSERESPAHRAPEPPKRAQDEPSVHVHGPRRTLKQTIRDLDPRAFLSQGPTLPFVALALAALVQQFDDQALGVLLPDIRADFAVDIQFILTMQAVLGFVFLQFGAPVLGFLADRLSRVWMLRVGSLAGYGSTIASGFAGSIPALVGTRAGVQIGNAAIQPAGFPLLADLFPSHVRGRLFAFLAVVGNLGAFAAPILAGTIGAVWGWRVAAVSLGAAALGVSVLLFLIREPPRGYADRKELGADEETARTEQRPVGWSEAWRSAHNVTTIRRLWYAAPFLGAGNAAVLGFMGLYYRDEFGASTQALGVITSLNFGAALIALAFAGGVADRLIGDNPGRIMTIMGAVLVLQAGTFAVLFVSSSLVISVTLNVVIAAIQGLFFPAYAAMLSLTVPARIRGLGMQSHLPLVGIGGLIFAFVGGGIADAVGFPPVFLILIPTSLMAAAILGTSSSGVARDIASARATALAQEEARRRRDTGAMLIARGLDVEHDGVQVLFGVDLDVQEGEILALLGTNGAGKSTLLRAIAGVHPASSGAVLLDGDDITAVPPHEMAERGVVMLPGGRAVFPTLTVRENLAAAKWRGAEPGATEAVLDTFPALRERLDVSAGDLSGGEQQMLAIGQALIMQPRLLMIDELSLGLAPAIVERLLGILRELHARGTTIVLVEQSVNLALTIAQRAVFMENGRIVYDGPTADLLRRGDIVRSVYLGSAVTGSELTVQPTRRRHRVRDSERATVLDARGITVRFGGVTAVDGVDVSVREREIVGIIGPNGAGKSTLFDAISGFVAYEGSVSVGERGLGGLSPAARARAGLGRSFQHTLLFPTLTVRDAIAVALEAQLDEQGPLTAAAWTPRVRRSEARVRRRVDHLIELMGLERAADAFVAELSTAMRRIVDLACVTAMGPRALLLDEPSSGLAQSEAEELGPLLRRLVAETGCGLVIIEHDVPMVAALADRLIAMDLGRVIAHGAPADVIADEAVVRAALGSDRDVIARSGARSEE